MYVASCEQMRNMDRLTVKAGIPSIILMENAAIALANELDSFSSVRIFVGVGNNGGDGYALARHLFFRGKKVEVIALPGEPSKDAKINHEIVKNLGIPIHTAPNFDNREKYDAVVDALFGTGLNSDITGVAENVIRYINSCGSYVLSVDIPSGINADTGHVCGIAVKANKTVTFEVYKHGLLQYPGSEYAGEIVVVPINIPPSVKKMIDFNTFVTTAGYVRSLFPMRESNSHKGTYGHVLSVAGSLEMSGAASLCTAAAIKSGCGLVTLACPHGIVPAVSASVREATFLPLTEVYGHVSQLAWSMLGRAVTNSDSVAFGCGLGNSKDTLYLLLKILETEKPTVIDADGINSIASNIHILKNANAIITPHPKEMASLTGLSVAEIQQNREKVASEVATQYKITVLLKGHHTVIASKDGTVYINLTGNAGMATGGSGDCLTGIIASFIAQGLNIFNAGVAGAYIHGLAGDLAKDRLGMVGMCATDILNEIPHALKVTLNF